MTKTRTLESPPRRVTRRDVLLALFFAGLVAATLADATRSIAELGWKSEELGYILLAPMMIAWLAYILHDRFATCRLRREWVGLLILAAGFFTYWYGYHTDPVIWRAGAVLAAVGAAVTCLGSDVLVRFAPAFAPAFFLSPYFPNAP